MLVPPSSELINPSSASVTVNAIASHSFPNLPAPADDVDGKEKLEKFSDLWTNSKVDSQGAMFNKTVSYK